MAVAEDCFVCKKKAYIAERVTALGKTYHKTCLRCGRCNKVLTVGRFSDHSGKPYCNQPCYAALFGPAGYGRGGVGSSIYDQNSKKTN